MALHRARHTYEPSRPLEPWLLGIARHVAIDHARRRLARLKREELVAALPEAAAQGDGPTVRGLDQALADSPRRSGRPSTCCTSRACPCKRRRVRAGTTTGALKVRAHRAYKALKQLLGG